MKNEIGEPFEGSEEDQLRLENELLKLRMQAELGAQFANFDNDKLPPEIEKQFLEQVMAFHQNLGEHPAVLLRDYLGNPDFRPAAELSADALEKAWGEIRSLYESKQLRVDFLADYPLARRYDFMAVELMEEEIDPPTLEGQYLCFIYEESHPNHDFDQRARTQEFMRGFFNGTFSDHYLAPQLITDSGGVIGLEKAQELLERFHGMFTTIREWEFRINDTSTQRDEEVMDDMPRLGFTEGLIRYTAVSPDGTEQEIVGPFKLYMECKWGWWQVMHFYMHGFSWSQD